MIPGQTWSSFFRSSSSSSANTNIDIENTGQPYPASDSISAFPEESAASSSATRSGNSLAEPDTASEDQVPLRLHAITEQKLEKAALGRSVGLRKLVLLSNAFASRLSSGSATPSLAETAGRDYEANIRDLEDELDRKKREEDWLDSVLDEMLTDEEEEDGSEGIDASSSDRALHEPYVHVSIKERQLASAQQLPLPPSPPMDNVDLLFPQLYHASNFEPEALELVRDSGFLEPSRIPLPESPDSSASSQASDDGQSTASAEDNHRASLEEGDKATESALESSQPAPIPIESPSRSYYGYLGPPGPPTPDLAYSVHSFMSNLSSSPSTSLHLATPSSSPPSAAFAFRKLEDSIHEEDMPVANEENEVSERNYDSLDCIMPMDGLDLEEDENDAAAKEDGESTSSSSGKSDATQREEQKPATLSSSLELVRYQPPHRAVALEETFRIHDSAEQRRPGLFSTKPYQPLLLSSPPFIQPTLPSPLLSTLLSQKPIHSFDVRQPLQATSLRTFNVSKVPISSKIQLPIVIPGEAMKSLYDSVDFGVPTTPLHGMKSPPPPIALELPLPSNFEQVLKRSKSPPPMSASQSTSAKSCPTSPRSNDS